MRGKLKSPSSTVMMKTSSTFAAKSCGGRSPDALRTSALVLHETASIVAGPSPIARLIAAEVADTREIGALHDICGCGPLCPPSAHPLRLRPDNGFDARLSRGPSAAWAVNSSCRRPLQPKASRVMFQSP